MVNPLLSIYMTEETGISKTTRFGVYYVRFIFMLLLASIFTDSSGDEVKILII